MKSGLLSVIIICLSIITYTNYIGMPMVELQAYLAIVATFASGFNLAIVQEEMELKEKELVNG